VYYAYNDYLGSILTLTDKTGAIAAKQNFDAWGRYRNPDDWTYNNVPVQPVWLYRGFTGHEHVAQFALINMNGRMYDPVLGRMLSPDNYVPLLWNTQGYNRYSYANNNPLVYVDPDGNFFFVPIIIGAIIGGYSGYEMGVAHGATGWNMFGYIAGGAAIGGVSGLAGGAVAVGIGQNLAFAGAGLVGAAVGGAVGGAISGSGFAALGGGNIIDGAWKGALSGLGGGAVGAYIGGGIGAFAGGATAGAVGSALNGGDAGDIIGSAFIGGAISWGSYNVEQEVAYRQYNKGSAPFGKLTREAFEKISVAAQRSFARGRETAGWILDNGDIGDITYGGRGEIAVPFKPANGVAFFHTHPNDPGTIEFQSINDVFLKMDKNYVIGWKNIYENNPNIHPFPVGSTLNYSPDYIYRTIMPSLLTTYQNNLNPYPYYWFYFGR